MNTDPNILPDEHVHLVRGCPCYREFGEEKVCLNSDSVFPINAISVDPSFFVKLVSKDQLGAFQSNNKNMCYLLMLLDRNEGFCYCVSQNQRISINKKDVKVSEIDSALQFVTSTEKSRDGVLCSDCLYRYLRTLGESSVDFLTDSEREEIIATYVRELATNLAVQLSNYETSEGVSDFNDHLWKYLREINRSRSHWASMILNLKKTEAEDELVELIEAYSTLARLESVFIFQVLSLDDPDNETDPLSSLRFMVGTSEKVISVSNSIRELTNRLMELNALPDKIQEMLSKHSEARKATEYKFSNLVSALHKIDARTT
ncbi:MAG: hypothetical protein AM325_009265 [Candidatus Thorarchaeota archaeon SMTZ1-45]|nr:MAG: hypothetical protein AM325_10765 [Candidatus Thorarchaeota archaeon SMTZ1-45]